MMSDIFSRRSPVSRRAYAFAASAFFLTGSAAHAVVVRGTVRDALNRPVASAPVQLVQNGQVMASGSSNGDGSYELRAAGAGRFILKSGNGGFAVYESQSFYGAELDLVTMPITLSPRAAAEQVTVTATGLPTPVEQTSAAIHTINAEELTTRTDLVPDLRLQPGIEVVQTGQNLGQTSIFVRGGNSDSNKVLIDGAPANDVGGVFDLGVLSSTGIASAEMHRGPDSVLYGSDALGSVLRIETPRGSTTKPVLNYSGDAGNFHTWRNEVEGSGAYRKLDYYAAFSRFDSSNALQMDRVHAVTTVGNFGYAINGSTQLRGTVRHGVSASGVPNAHDFYGISAAAKQADQNTVITGVLENTFRGNWHNLVRYYASRRREQYTQFYPAGTLLDTPYGPEYFGNTVTIVGANGYTATGRAAIAYTGTYPQPRFSVNNRDGVQYQSDYRFTPHASVLVGFRYEDERGVSINPGYFTNDKVERRNYDYSAQFQGDIKGRVFYSLGGAVQKNYVYGTEGTPRIGLSYYPVRPSDGWFHGTKIHFNFSKGVQEPNLSAQLGSLRAVQAYYNRPTDLASPIGAERSRTYEGGVDQNIFGRKLLLRFNYFHNEFGNQIEYVGSFDLQTYFGITVPSTSYGAYVNSLDFKAQGIETSAEWRPSDHFYIRGGYTYMDAVVQRSFASDVTAQLQGFPSTNPNIPGIAIGSSSPLVGQRPFRRPPQTGYIVGQYARGKWSFGLKSAFVSRADDSTFLGYSDVNSDNTLLLPNRNLDFAYQRVDLDGLWQVKKKIGLFTQMNNLLGQQRMGPIGYPALPFNFRVGVKVRLGGE